MSPIFQEVITDEAKTVIKRRRTAQVVLTEPLQVIAEDEELNLNLKFNTPRSRPRRSLCKQPSKIEHPPSHHATLSLCSRSPAPASHYRHRHSACPPSTTTVHLCPSTTHVCASWNPLSVSKPSQPSSSENQFQSDLLFSTVASALQFGKRSEKPDSDPLVQKCRRILMDDFKRAFPDGKVPDPFTLPKKEECAYAA
jgi:hypothetical protein